MTGVAEAPQLAGVLADSGRRLRVGIIGCGDVAHRWYLPALEHLADRVEITASCDPRSEAAERIVTAVEGWSPGTRAFTELDAFLTEAELDAVFNLSPAPLHSSITRACLEAGVHVYSEKPLAAALTEADELIALAAAHERLLLCAPGVAVTRRFKWLAEIVETRRFGTLTLAVAHHADPGPAAWREYTGDPSVFYREGVGPLIDHGIYRLHGLTMLMGPVRRVQAMGAIGQSTRVVRGGPLTGQTIPVTTPDHVLVNLEFTKGGLGQLLASFGTPSTLAPWMELHFEKATISFPGASWDPDGTASIYVDDDGPLGLEAWTHDVDPPPPADALPVVGMGAAHFIACLRSEEQPVLTAEHARHVLDIIVKTYASIEDGASHQTETAF